MREQIDQQFMIPDNTSNNSSQENINQGIDSNQFNSTTQTIINPYLILEI